MIIKCQHMFFKKKKKPLTLTIVSPILTGIAIIAFWRGLWGLMDLYLFPDNEPLSYIVSVVIGLLLLYLVHLDFRDLES